MKISITSLIIGCILLFGCSDDDSTNPANEDELIANQLQEIVDSKIGADKLVGVSISIRVDGIERWNLQGGTSAFDQPVESDMKFGIGSITKNIVAATVLKLVDEGTLSLDDTIGDWLDLNSPNVNNTAQIIQLLNHQTGIEGYMYPELWARAEANLDTPIPQIELVDYIGPPTNEPGVTHEYSNSNYLLLGLIIEGATGKTVGEVMREKFWTPLDLPNVYFGTNEVVPEPICTPWRDTSGDGILEDIKDDYGAAFNSIFYCAADVFSTASDLSMWAEHVFNGSAISDNSKSKMLTSYFDIPHPTFLGYGLGARKNVYAGRVLWGHTGGMRGYGSHMFYDLENNVSIVSLNNQSRSNNGSALRHELVDELLSVVFDYIEN